MQFVDDGGKICYIVFKAKNRGVYIAERKGMVMGRKAVRKTGTSTENLQKNNAKGGIMKTLIGAFLVPVVLMIVLGVVSYNTASSGILTKYNESAMSTVSAMGDYCGLLCDSISAKALEVSTDNTLIDYYNFVKQNRQDYTVMEALRDTRTVITNAKSINKYMYSCTVIPEYGSYITTLPGTLTEDPYNDFLSTTEGKYFTDNPSIKNRWMGYHTYLDENLGSSPEKYAVAFYQKVLQSNTTIVMDISMPVIMDMLSKMDLGEGSIRALVTSDGREIVSIQGREEEEAQTEGAYFVGNSFFEETRALEEAGSREVATRQEEYVYVYTPVGKTGIMICALIPKNSLLKQVESIKHITIFMVILASFAALAIGSIISAGISKTVKMVTKELSAVAEGDLSRHFKTGRKDEFRILVTALNSTIDSMRLLMKDMKGFGAKVNELAESVSGKAQTTNESMHTIARTMDEMAKGAQGQAKDAESSNLGMESFAENIYMVTVSTQEMTQTADEAIGAVEQGTVIVQDLSEKSDAAVALTKVLVSDIDDVSKNSEEIKHVVDIISSIAEQTNLLSLNASIEAARAGEAGRGFAVVAQEIRALADQSKESGGKIRSIVENIGETTSKTTQSARKTEDMINSQAQALAETVKVFDMIRTCVSSLVDGIREVTEKLDQAIQEGDIVQNAIQNISAVSEQVAASSGEVSETLAEQVSTIGLLLKEAEILREDAEELGSSIDKFKI